MAGYHSNAIAELAHQLRLSPVRLRLRQLEAAEYLTDLVESDRSYPYDFVCSHITGYRPKAASLPQKSMPGRLLIEDLAILVEELTGALPLSVRELPCACYTAEELSSRLRVSTKTICRWRRRGLVGRKLRFPDNTVRMAFTETCVRRFVARHVDLVRRGAAFRQLTGAEKQQIITLARQSLDQRRVRLHELSQLIAGQMGRAVETIRYTLRRYDQAHPEAPLFGRDDQPNLQPELQEIWNAVQAGQSIAQVARRSGRSVENVRALLREIRARTMRARLISYIPNAEFEAADADDRILGTGVTPPALPSSRIRPPRDLPPYLQDLYRQPLLAPEHERDLFRRYNYLKYRADLLRRELDVTAATDRELDRIEGLLSRAEEVKNEILRANLRLVVSIARKHVGKAPCFFEIVSDGNLSLMRAVEKFDYARGFKFSTYASWAIMRNYARSIPEHMYHSARLITGTQETLAATPARDESTHIGVLEGAQHLVQRALSLLSPRERDIISWHYGLSKEREPMTLDQIGKIFGVTKERVRQIERKALARVRSLLEGPSPEQSYQPERH